jgi:hypothetical protein
MEKKYFRFFSLGFFLIGIFFLLNSRTDITGAVVGISSISSSFSSIFGLVFLVGSLALFVSGRDLGEKLDKIEEIAHEHHWEPYSLNKDSIIKDVEQEYLDSQKDYKKSPIQERIERMVNRGKTIGAPNKKRDYEKQFYEGHASQGGRVIDIQSHLIHSKDDLERLMGDRANLSKGIKFYEGRIVHLDENGSALAKGNYLWVVDEEGNFIVANRQTFQHEMNNMNKEEIDHEHRLHKLPHATLAKGRKIYGSGEVLIEGGLIKEVNTYSGHYLPVTLTPGTDPNPNEKEKLKAFDIQGKEVFKELSKKYGWNEVSSGAKYI